MSQRKALIASLVITLVLALSAVGLRATLFDSQGASADPQSGVTVAAPGIGSYDDDDRYEESDDDEEYTSNTNDQDEQDDHDESEDTNHEEEHEDDEH